MTGKITTEVDILSVGELLVDLIGRDFADDFSMVKDFKRVFGGSPANLAMNMARLGNRVELAATVGGDPLGAYLIHEVKKLGVSTHRIRQCTDPTTAILVTRSTATADFIPYRGADKQILTEQLPAADGTPPRIFHTTCFALSKDPARTVILKAAERIAKAGGQLSIDANYSGKIWPDRAEALAVVEQYCRLNALIKVSDVDYLRLLHHRMESPQTAAEYFLHCGARAVCVTEGAKGLWVANQTNGVYIAGRRVEVKDTTGAGDAFWSGFLTAWLDNKGLEACGMAGRAMAELKIGHFGPLPEKVNRDLIYE
ncbi:MAG: PfkB family carbohydrate kinase [Bacteroidota bacterium]